MAAKISIIIPCLNEESNIVRCLDAIGRQTYAHEAIQVLVADGMSTDRTRELIGKWRSSHDINVEIVDNERVVAEFGNAEALKSANGDFIYLMGVDEEMAQEDFLSTFMESFDIFPSIVGVEQDFLKIRGGNVCNNYLAVIHINDPLARDIASTPRQTALVERGGKRFREYEFAPGYPAKLLFTRTSIASFIGKDTFEEGQVMLHLALAGNNRMATVDGYGVYHHNVASLGEYLKKRARIALKHTTRVRERRTWVSYTGKKIYVFALLHLTLIYPFLFSIYKAIRHRERLWLLHAPIGFASTFLYACSWVRIKLLGKRAW